MRKAMLLLAVFGCVGLVWAQSPFDGTWKEQAPPTVNVLKDGILQTNEFSGVKAQVKADGTDQPFPASTGQWGTPDTIAIKVVDAKTVEMTIKKGGKVLNILRNTVSANGKTSTVEILGPDGKVVFTQVLTRVAAGPPGSHATSGTWSGPGPVFTFKSSPDGLMETAQSEWYEAKFDGKEYPVTRKLPDNMPDEVKRAANSAPMETVSLKKLNDRSIDEIRKQNGKVTIIYHMTVSADGKTINAKVEDKMRGTTSTLVSIKQ